MLTPALIRGARAMVQLSQDELSRRAGIGKATLAAIEVGKTDPRASTLSAIQRVLEDAGAEFTNAARPAVRLRGDNA